MPVGKARRTAKAEREPDEVPADEPADETVEAEPAAEETPEAESEAALPNPLRTNRFSFRTSPRADG